MKFGFSYATERYTTSLELWETARDAGLDQAWSWDSHVLWQECWSLMGWLIGTVKPDFEFGTCVTNPRTRDPIVTASAFATLNQITDGRMICGIGRGDSSVRVLKRKPANLADVEHAVHVIRTLGSGAEMRVDGIDARIPWARHEVPVYVAAYGPKALRLAGRVGDGVILQIADPFVIEWALRQVRASAEEARRDPDDITVHCAAPTYISDDLDEARAKCRWFGAMVGNHIADVLRHHDPEGLPDELVSYVEKRTHYDYHDHAGAGAEHADYVPDEIVDRFAVIGTTEQCAEKLRELERLGVSEFNIYTQVENILEIIETYGKAIAPGFRAPSR
ncbi:MAG TPA: TIGR03842 family LLM class F420-dependent oxidoreductase [Thermoleophilaceae bacterium]